MARKSVKVLGNIYSIKAVSLSENYGTEIDTSLKARHCNW